MWLESSLTELQPREPPALPSWVFPTRYSLIYTVSSSHGSVCVTCFNLPKMSPVQLLYRNQRDKRACAPCVCVFPNQPPLSPKSLAHFSNSSRPFLLTLGLILSKLASKSPISMGRICSFGVNRRASPRCRKGPIAASFASAVMSEPE